MIWPNLTTSILMGTAIGLLSAFAAHRRGKNKMLWFSIGFFFGLFGFLFFFLLPKGEKKQTMERPKPVPQPYLMGPSDKFWYYLDPNHERQGPMSYTAISNAWKQGKINPATFIWHEDLTDWSPLENLIEMREAP